MKISHPAVALCLLTFAVPSGASAQATTSPRTTDDAARNDPAETWRAEFEEEARGLWLTSNAQYMEEDGGIERFGLDWWVHPGGRSGGACLWGERGDETMVFWVFSRLWDPVEQRGIVHQASPQGGIALGYQTPGDDSGLVQTLVMPGGVRMEIRHETTMDGPDVRIDRAFRRAATTEPWTPTRSYRWERDVERSSPCVMGAPAS